MSPASPNELHPFTNIWCTKKQGHSSATCQGDILLAGFRALRRARGERSTRCTEQVLGYHVFPPSFLTLLRMPNYTERAAQVDRPFKDFPNSTSLTFSSVEQKARPPDIVLEHTGLCDSSFLFDPVSPHPGSSKDVLVGDDVPEGPEP